MNPIFLTVAGINYPAERIAHQQVASLLALKSRRRRLKRERRLHPAAFSARSLLAGTRSVRCCCRSTKHALNDNNHLYQVIGKEPALVVGLTRHLQVFSTNILQRKKKRFDVFRTRLTIFAVN